MPGVLQILKVVEGVNTLFKTGGNVAALIEIVTGDGGSAKIVNAIASLQSDVVTLINTFQTQSATQQWSAFASTFSTLQARCAMYSSDLATLNHNDWTINSTSTGRIIPFQSWCEGSDGNTGALGTLMNGISTLQTNFALGGNANLSLFAAWEKLSDAAMSDRSSRYFGQTRWTMMYLLMQETYQILSSTFLLRLSILKLYLSQHPENPYRYDDEAAFVARAFGNTSDPSTIWGKFAARFQSYTAPKEPSGQYKLCASSNDSFSGPDSSKPINGLDAWYTGVFDGPTSISSEPNAFFSAVRLACAKVVYKGPKSGPKGLLDFFRSHYHGYAMYLTGTAVVVEPGLEFRRLGEGITTFRSSTYVLTPKSKILDGYFSAYRNLNTSSVAPPARPDNNVVNVVTGFQLVQCNGNRYGIALQFGQLDISDPMNPRVTVVDKSFHPPTIDSHSFFPIQGWDDWNVNVEEIDTRPAGPDDTTFVFPMSNLTFSQVNPTGVRSNGKGNRVGLLMQSALPTYEADFFQPDKTLIPKETPTSPV